ncbi:MAG: hypothetical protein KDC49_01685 [Saprospiraceae bacterium]|nr:hypothetical protein [Saprospiraceae bacterium]
MKNITKLCLFLLLFVSCQRSITYSFIKNENIEVLEEEGSQCACNDPAAYVPDTVIDGANHNYLININYHALDFEKGKHNFSLEEMSPYFWLLTENANMRLRTNEKMKLPVGNLTPVIDPYYQYRMKASPDIGNTTALYHHRLDERTEAYFLNKGEGQNNFSRSVTRLAVHEDSILNVLVMSYPPDELEKSPQKYHGAGISLGTIVKIAGLYQKGGEYWAYATLLNHEIGHAFGLAHAWIADGCDDTPTNPNCFDDNSCKGPSSNNLMDYNNSQMAMTPCQIGRVRMIMASEKAYQRKLLVHDWCTNPTGKTITIDQDIVWAGARDIDGDIIIKSGASLRLCCRVSMPENSKIVVESGGQLILDNVRLHNSCGLEWGGIIVEKRGRKSGSVVRIGEVSLE